MWLTALLTPKREGQKADVCDVKGKEAAPQVEMRDPGDVSLMTHLFPCSGSCLHHGAPEPRRCQWTHRWERQPETDLEDEGSGQKAVRGLIYLSTVWLCTCLTMPNLCWCADPLPRLGYPWSPGSPWLKY